ncbi:hypothetical protein B6U84_04730 [Candidatus Bathyarchaeota archaeon ex4484_40]|nr:MAG: hypothetical protein B6U84_04730 [Candidatus Bathyarchaeota archaeon ex4484_40]
MTYLWKFKKFPEPGVNPRYIRILLYLKDNGPTSSRELAMNLGYSVKAMRRALQLGYGEMDPGRYEEGLDQVKTRFKPYRTYSRQPTWKLNKVISGEDSG